MNSPVVKVYEPPHKFVETRWLSVFSVEQILLTQNLLERCPRPKYDQTVFLYDMFKQEYKRLWDLPPKNISDAVMMYEFQEGDSYTDERSNMRYQYELANHIIDYKYGLLDDKANKNNYFLARSYQEWLREQEEENSEEDGDSGEDSDGPTEEGE